MKYLVKSSSHTPKVTIVANQKTEKNVRADKYYKEASFDVTVKDDSIEAKQTGVNKITVKGADLTDKVADYVVKRGTVTLSVKSVTLNAKTEAVLQASSSTMPKGDYTLSFNKGDEVAFTVEEGVVSKIVVDPEVAILSAADAKAAYTYFKVLNQFDEDVTAAEIANIEVTGGSKDAEIGKVTFSNGSTPYTLGLSTVALSIVCKTNGVNYVKVLNVEGSPKLAETEFKGVYKLNAKTGKYEEAEVSVNSASILNQYYLVFAAKDQYGMQAADSVTGGGVASLQVNLSSVTSLKVGTGEAWSALANKLGDYTAYIAYPLDKEATATLRAGEVSVLGVQLTDGKTVTGKFTVAEKQLIDTLTVTATGYVYGGQDNVLEFTALDQEGKEVKDYDTLKNFTFTDTRLSFEPKADGTAKLVYDTPENTQTIDTPAVLTWLSQTNKFGQANISIKPNRVLKAVIGVVSGKTLAMTTGTTTLAAVDFIYQDQYGNAVTVDDDLALVAGHSANKTITITTTSDQSAFSTAPARGTTVGAVATDTAMKVNVIRNAVSAGSISFKVAIDGVAASDYTFSISNVDLANVSNFEIGDINRVKVTSAAGADASFKVFGYTNGTKVELVEGTDYSVHGSTKTAPTIADSEGSKVKEQEVVVIIANAAGTTLTKKFEYSNAPAAPVTVTANPKYVGPVAATKNNNVTTSSFTTSGYGSTNVVLVTDQYGAHGSFSPRVTFSGFSADATVTGNGTTDAEIKWSTDGYKSVNVKYVYDNGVTFETTVVVEVAP